MTGVIELSPAMVLYTVVRSPDPMSSASWFSYPSTPELESARIISFGVKSMNPSENYLQKTEDGVPC